MVRELTPDDWRQFRAVRLKALRENPGLYLSSYSAELEKPEEWWTKTLDGQGKKVFALVNDDKIIGIAAVFTWSGNPSGCSAQMAMDYIVAEWRGKGFMRRLNQSRLNWAIKQRQFARLVTSHRDGNEVSRRAIQAFGFELTGREMIEWPDGANAEEWMYEIDLEILRNRQESANS
jgi:RimJ/RimL family protein N-acetyltransferase